MEIQPPEELLKILEENNAREKERRELLRTTSRLYRLAEQTLEEYDADKNLPYSGNLKDKPKHTPFIPLPFGRNNSLVLFNNKWIGMEEGMTIAIMSKDDKDEDFMSQRLFRMHSLIGRDRPIVVHINKSDGTKIETVEETKVVEKTLNFINAYFQDKNKVSY